ncbi:hypothetical protein EBN03_32185 [Nocardia stercoris]|uniref:Uncharacterized protein n=1 Tax=Nocardia stercoris TaxID=2483361 RepID=A0A3M2KWX6_9NOCA|nr:hypothetical protein EBN03_32185 [Nocardia stercoris]
MGSARRGGYSSRAVGPVISVADRVPVPAGALEIRVVAHRVGTGGSLTPSIATVELIVRTG